MVFGVDGWEQFKPIRAPGSEDRLFARRFLNQQSDPQGLSALFGYFVAGFARHAAPGFARVHYPGIPSIRGFKVTGLEGFARTAPLLGAWLHAGRAPLVGGLDLVAMLGQGILNGTQTDGPQYWGDIGDDDQRLVEAADIARTLWLTRRHLWDIWSHGQKAQVASWLLRANRSHIRVRNNWLLFPVVVNAALNALGWPAPDDYNNYWEFKALHYRERGWFHDIPEGIDYYNCWGITYDLFWIDRLAPQLDHAFLADAILQSAGLTAHLISPKGIPIMGRSVCYRTAVPVPLVAAAHHGKWPGLARRGLRAVWDYFVAKGILTDGTLTMGYFGNDPRLIDDYTGPGSSHWGLRGLVLAFMLPDDAPFWCAPRERLPVEIRDFDLRLPVLGWRVQGCRASGEITVSILTNHREAIRMEPMTLQRTLAEWSDRVPRRPKNHAAKYLARTYRAIRPFPAIG